MDAPAYLTAIAEHWIVITLTTVIALAVLSITVLFLTYLNRQYLKKRDMAWLEVTPPASVSKTPEATAQLFSVIHGLRAARPLKDRLLKRTPVFSFEITSTKQHGIRYLIQTERSKSESVQKSVAAYIPDAKVSTVEYQLESAERVVEFRQTSHYVLPLTLTGGFEQHDPLSYVTNAMTKLEENERATLQLIVSPVKLNEAARLSRRILGNEDILKQAQSSKFSLLSSLGSIFSGALIGFTDTIGEVHHGATASHSKNKSTKDAQFQQQVQKRQRPARTLSAFELELMETMHQKVTQPLFRVNLRVMISGDNGKDHEATVRSALDAYSVPPYQALRAKAKLPLLAYYRKSLANLRLPAVLQRQSLILSASEIDSSFNFCK